MPPLWTNAKTEIVKIVGPGTQLETRPDVLKVARGPFLEDGAGRVAFVIDDEVAFKRSILTGSTSISEVEIVSGLEIGDRIIISDIARFEDAENVLLR